MTVDVFKRLQEYVGREYRVDYNCAHLSADVQLDVFNKVVHLPAAAPGGQAGQRRLIRSMQDEMAVRIDVPFPGCAVLLSEPATDGGDLLHIGTVAVRVGEVFVLHNSAKLGSAQFDTLDDLQRMGMRFEGYFAWK